MRVLVAVVAYEAEAFIESLLDRIPRRIEGVDLTVLVSDDDSTDATAERASKWGDAHREVDLRVVRRPSNLGYGGNQKTCFAWASEEGFDVAVLLHGDEQYPPERIGDLIEPIRREGAGAVFGSRMLEAGAARRGGMPLVRYLGNRVISGALNVLTRQHLSEWFDGFRAYQVSTLDELRIDELPDGFDFDTAIMVRLLARGVRIREVSIPTRYAEEVSRVPLLRTGLAALRNGLRHRWAAR